MRTKGALPMSLTPQKQQHYETATTFGAFAPAAEYLIDAVQRNILFWDVMRQRGNKYRERQAETAPHVLEFAVALELDGRTLDRPVNYGLVRIIPPKDVKIDLNRR